jgi:RNA polymerase sigma-70 factor (ECF subfamily)
MAASERQPTLFTMARKRAGNENRSGSDVDDEVVGFYDELHEPLYRYFLYRGLPADDAAEGVQETFLRLFEHLRARGNRTNLRGWIFQVARNLIRDEFKSARRRRTEQFDATGERGRVDHADPRGNPEEQILRLERLRRLPLSFEHLTTQQRECLFLRASGLRYREISEVLSISISNVGELVQRAIDQLREDLR